MRLQNWKPGISNMRDGMSLSPDGTSILTVVSWNPSSFDDFSSFSSSFWFAWATSKPFKSSTAKSGWQKTSSTRRLTSAWDFSLLPEFCQFRRSSVVMFVELDANLEVVLVSGSMKLLVFVPGATTWARSSEGTVESGSYDGQCWYSRKKPNMFATVCMESRTIRRTRRSTMATGWSEVRPAFSVLILAGIDSGRVSLYQAGRR